MIEYKNGTYFHDSYDKSNLKLTDRRKISKFAKKDGVRAVVFNHMFGTKIMPISIREFWSEGIRLLGKAKLLELIDDALRRYFGSGVKLILAQSAEDFDQYKAIIRKNVVTSTRIAIGIKDGNYLVFFPELTELPN